MRKSPRGAGGTGTGPVTLGMVAELGLVPNPITRGLAGGRTMSVGVFTQAIDSPVYGVALRGIEDERNARVGAEPIETSHGRSSGPGVGLA